LLNHALLPVNEEKQPRFYYGYTILITSFLILVIAGGALYSFGVFFKPLLNEFGWTRAVTSGAYSLNLVLGGGFGILAGRLSDRFGPRLILTLGGLLVGLGYLLMSQVNAIWQVYLFYGILVSMGMGALTVPVPSAVVRWFSKKRGLATGIVMAGIGVGIVIMPPLANLFISNYSWRTSYTILGITLAAIVILAQFMRCPPDQKNHVKAVSNTVNTDVPNLQAQGLSLREAIRTGKFWIVILIGFFCYFGTQTVMVHLVAHAFQPPWPLLSCQLLA
jgi:MFS transporter, OFA family, oxalate/formate antiporter